MVELERLGQLSPFDGAKVMMFGLQNDSSAQHALSKASAFCQYVLDFPYAYTISTAIVYQFMVVIASLGKGDDCG